MTGNRHEAHRRHTRERLLHMVREGGPTWHETALATAKLCEQVDPSLHRGLEAEVRRAIKATTQGATA